MVLRDNTYIIELELRKIKMWTKETLNVVADTLAMHAKDL